MSPETKPTCILMQKKYTKLYYILFLKLTLCFLVLEGHNRNSVAFSLFFSFLAHGLHISATNQPVGNGGSIMSHMPCQK